MFGILENLTKAELGVVTTPVAIVADVITMGGAMTDQDKPYTAKALEDVYDNLKNATTPKE